MSKLELLKCPCCGRWPEVYHNYYGYYCNCTSISCNFTPDIWEYSRTDAIRAWNEEVLKYKESKNE